MKEEIRKVLEHLILEEQLEVILDIVDTLLSLDYELALDELSAVIMMADDHADSAMLVERINDILRIALDYILGSYEVEMTDEATLPQRHAVVKTLVGIPLYILPDDISAVIEAEYDNRETLAHIVTMFERIDVDEVLETILSISQGAFDSIRTTIRDIMAVRGVAETSETPIERIRQINQVVNALGRDKVSMMLELANAGVRVGRPLDSLLEISFEALESNNIVDATYQMIGLIWLSDVPLDKMHQTVIKTLSEYTENTFEYGLMLDAYTDYRKQVGELK